MTRELNENTPKTGRGVYARVYLYILGYSYAYASYTHASGGGAPPPIGSMLPPETANGCFTLTPGDARQL